MNEHEPKDTQDMNQHNPSVREVLLRLPDEKLSGPLNPDYSALSVLRYK